MSDREATVRRIYERWSVGDFRAGMELFDPQIVFVLTPELPDPGTHLGPQQVSRYMRGFLEPWERLTITAEEMVGSGDSVVVAVLQRGIGYGSGAPAELRYFHVWTFRGERVIRFEAFRGREEALAAVGLRGGGSAS